MLKEVGASGQISLGKKYAGQLFDLQRDEDGSLKLTPVKVVPVVQEERGTYAAKRTPAEVEAAHNQWEEENKEAIAAMNKRMTHIGSMARRIHEWRKDQAAQAASS